MTVKTDVENTMDTAADQIESSARTAQTTARDVTDKATAKTAQMSRDGIQKTKAAMAKAETGSQQMMDWAMQAYQANVAAFQAMLASRSPRQVMMIQNDLIRDQMNLMMDAGSRMRGAMTSAA